MEHLLNTIREERARYGVTMGHDECARLCNAVAWRHRAEGWGVNAKSTGTFGTLPNGVKIAHDILHHLPSNQLIDILTAAGAESQPTWNPVGPPQSPDRVFIPAINPVTWATSPTPAPTTSTPPSQLDAIMTRLNELETILRDCVTVQYEMRDNARMMEDKLKRGIPVRVSLPVVGRVSGTVGGV